MKKVVIFVLVALCYGIPLMIKPTNATQNSTRYQNIYVPKAPLFLLRIVPLIFPNYWTFIAPDKKINGYDATIDICQTFEDQLFQLHPSWNGTDFCSAYFCSESVPYFLNETNAAAISTQKLIPGDAHMAMHRLCTQCASTMKQSVNGSNCFWFNNEYCNNICYESTCVYYEEKMNICYVENQERYLFRNDFTHNGLAWLYIYYSSIIVFVLNIVMLLLSLIVLVIPECVNCFKKCADPLKNPKQKIVSNFTWRGLMIVVIIATIIFNGVLSFLDIFQQMAQTGVFGGRWRNISTLVTVGIEYIIELLLFIQWYSVYIRSTTAATGLGPIRITLIVIMLVLMLSWGILGAILYLIGSITDAQAAFILLGIWTILSGIFLVVLLILLLVYSTKILRILTQVSDQASQTTMDKATKVLNVRLTKFMIGLSISLFWLVIFALIMGLQFCIGIDVFSIEFHFVFNCFCNIILMMVMLVIIIGLSSNFWCRDSTEK